MKAKLVSSEDEYIASHQGAAASETGTLNADAGEISEEEFRRVGGVRVQSTGPDLLRLYKRSAYGWNPVSVPSNMLKMLLQGEGKGNYKTSCGDCGSQECPGLCRAKLQYRTCPVPSCHKKVYDNPPTEVREVEQAPGEIQDDAYILSTPEARTKAKLDAHMFHYHPSEMRSLAPEAARAAPATPPPGRLEEVS